MFEVRQYTPDKADEWNRFVAKSKNGTFLFDRQFMDYHADRFTDASLMFYRDNSLYALLPANVKGDVKQSRQHKIQWYQLGRIGNTTQRWCFLRFHRTQIRIACAG